MGSLWSKCCCSFLQLWKVWWMYTSPKSSLFERHISSNMAWRMLVRLTESLLHCGVGTLLWPVHPCIMYIIITHSKTLFIVCLLWPLLIYYPHLSRNIITFFRWDNTKWWYPKSSLYLQQREVPGCYCSRYGKKMLSPVKTEGWKWWEQFTVSCSRTSTLPYHVLVLQVKV